MAVDDPEFADLTGETLELADLLNTALDKGVVVHGEVTLAVADIDLVKLNVGLLLAALETVESRAGRSLDTRPTLASVFGPPHLAPAQERAEAVAGVEGGAGALQSRSSLAPPFDAGHAPTAPSGTTSAESPAAALSESSRPETSLNAVAHGLPERINADAAGPESGLARLVLTLIEVLRKVLEHQAVRRMDGGKLSPAEIERLGLALSRLDDRMQELKKVFGLSDADLQIDLGPLGRLR